MNIKLTGLMRKTMLFSTLYILSIFHYAFCQDTFSIIAIDSLTQEIGAAGATCSDGIASLGGVKIINQIIPGKGGVNAQAWICNPNTNLTYAIDQINNNRSAKEVLDSLLNNDKCNAQDFDTDFRQYGILTIDENKNIDIIAHTGEMTSPVKDQRTGKDYAIIGNNLTSKEVLDAMESTFVETTGTLAERILATMQAGKSVGGDARCSDRGTSSTSTFLRVYKPDDEPDNPYLYLNIAGVPQGVEPLDSLQVLYDDFIVGVKHFNELTNDFHILNTLIGDEDLHFSLSIANFSPFKLNIYNIAGVSLLKQYYEQQHNLYTINLSNLDNGLYILTVQVDNNLVSKRFQILR